MKIVKGGVTKAKGFEAAGVEANIKYQGRTDMAIIFSKEPCIAKSRVQQQEHLRRMWQKRRRLHGIRKL